MILSTFSLIKQMFRFSRLTKQFPRPFCISKFLAQEDTDDQSRCLLILYHLYGSSYPARDTSSKNIKNGPESNRNPSLEQHTIQSDADARFFCGDDIRPHRRKMPTRYKAAERDSEVPHRCPDRFTHITSVHHHRPRQAPHWVSNRSRQRFRPQRPSVGHREPRADLNHC